VDRLSLLYAHHPGLLPCMPIVGYHCLHKMSQLLCYGRHDMCLFNLNNQAGDSWKFVSLLIRICCLLPAACHLPQRLTSCSPCRLPG
jgi:hypothetical protein